MKIRTLTVAAVLTAAAMLAFAPAANAEEGPPTTGCVWSGSGWIGAGEICPTDPPPNELEPAPSEDPAPEPSVEPEPSEAPAEEPASEPTEEPSEEPTVEPSEDPAPEPEPTTDPVDETPAPIVVDTAPRIPLWNDVCGTANDTWTDPGNTPDAPWGFFATDPVVTPGGEVVDPGYVYAMLPDTHVMPNGNRIWEPVWELFNVFTDEPCPVNVVDEAPQGDVDGAAGVTELAETGTDTPILLATAIVGAGVIALGVIMLRRRVLN